jgi:hypothetical protein
MANSSQIGFRNGEERKHSYVSCTWTQEKVARGGEEGPRPNHFGSPLMLKWTGGDGKKLNWRFEI